MPQHRISSLTFYKSNAKKRDLEASFKAKRQKMPEDGKTKPKRLLAEMMLNNAIIEVVASEMITPPLGGGCHLPSDHP